MPEALPHIRIYDRMGKLRQSFPISKKPFRAEDIDRVIEELLAAQAGG